MRFHPLVFGTLGLLAGLTPFAIDMYLPSIPAIAQDLSASIETVQLTLTAYLAVFALAQLLLGPASDVFGRRAIILGGLAVFVLASLGCAAAPSLPWLMAGRCLQALGGAAVAVTIPALVRDVFEQDEYARTMSILMLVMALAPLIAPLVGGIIVSHASWHWVFIALAGIALIGAVLFIRVIQETLHVDDRHRFHFGGIARNYAQLLTHPVGLGYLLTSGLSFAGMMTFIVTSPYVYIELYGVSPDKYGLLFGVNVLTLITLGALNARLVRRLGAERLLRVGLGLLLLTSLLMLALSQVQQPPLGLLVAASACFIGLNGFIVGNSMAGFMTFFPKLAGTASAFAGTLRFGLGAIAGTLASLLHNGTFVPMVDVMAGCGLSAIGSYVWLCRQTLSQSRHG
jgi:DHA1 family bicyclomycin/chloramphenicol resistance-like MFS transporter